MRRTHGICNKSEAHFHVVDFLERITITPYRITPREKRERMSKREKRTPAQALDCVGADKRAFFRLLIRLPFESLPEFLMNNWIKNELCVTKWIHIFWHTNENEQSEQMERKNKIKWNNDGQRTNETWQRERISFAFLRNDYRTYKIGQTHDVSAGGGKGEDSPFPLPFCIHKTHKHNTQEPTNKWCCVLVPGSAVYTACFT